MANALKIENVSKRFGTFYAVKQLSLTIPERAIYGLLGPTEPARPRPSGWS